MLGVPDGPHPDMFPPCKITDLEAMKVEDDVVLSWTAPGEDFDQGQSRLADLFHKYLSTDSIFPTPPPPLCVCSHFLLFSISTLQKASLVKAKARDSSITQHELYTITHREDDIIFLILAFKKISSAPGSHFSMSLYIATWYSVISHTYIP